MNNKPLVSVCMITYLHQDYIVQAIESILMQQTNFDFELIIANDASPDNTDNVIQNFIQSNKKSDCISYYNHSENIGMYKNFLFALKQCKSKYIALCEGDDYWLDPLKLQKQVNFLEANPSYEVSFTNIKIIHENGDIVKEKLINDNRKTNYITKDLPIWAPTLTRVFKNRDFKPIPDAPGLDTVMLLYQSKFGKINFLNEVTGVYRLHKDSVYSSKSFAKRKAQIIQTDLASLQFVEPKLYPKYFGMMLKKLVELKSINFDLFNSNRLLFIESFKDLSNKLSFIANIKINISLIMLFLLFKNSPQFLSKFCIKIINKMLIYKN